MTLAVTGILTLFVEYLSTARKEANAMLDGSYIYTKEIDWSALHQGISIPLTIQKVFIDDINKLIPRGKTVQIKILLNGKTYSANLVNQKFDERKYPTHKDILQIRYSPQSELARYLRSIFTSSYSYLLKQRELQERQYSRITVPKIKKEYLAIYSTKYPATFLFDCISYEENNAFEKKIKQLREVEYENIINLSDPTSGYYNSKRINKIRKLNSAIGNSLKALYENRCQICGHNVSIRYETAIVEAHHIVPYTVSLNNNPDNILILCPNHHVIIHKTNPSFDWKRLSYHFNNGLEEHLSLNRHLRISG